MCQTSGARSCAVPRSMVLRSLKIDERRVWHLLLEQHPERRSPGLSVPTLERLKGRVGVDHGLVLTRSRGPKYRQRYRAETYVHLRARFVVRIPAEARRRAANALATAISSLSADTIASAIACMRLSRLKANSRSCSRAATRRAASRRKLPSAVLAASAAAFNSTRNDPVIVIVFRRMAEESGSRTHQGPSRGPSRFEVRTPHRGRCSSNTLITLVFLHFAPVRKSVFATGLLPNGF